MKEQAYSELLEVVGHFELHLVLHVDFVDLPVEPRVVQQVLGGGSLRGVRVQRPHDEVLRFRRNHVPNRVVETQASLHYTPENFVLGLTLEGGPSAQQNVGDNSDAPNVNFVVVGLFLNNLRSHVQGRAKDFTQALFLGVEEAGKTEVSDFYVKVVGVFTFQEDVFRL